MQENKGDLSQLDILDGLHETAVEQSIITPYSSMIVLVDARQQRLLVRESAVLRGRTCRVVEQV